MGKSSINHDFEWILYGFDETDFGAMVPDALTC